MIDEKTIEKMWDYVVETSICSMLVFVIFIISLITGYYVSALISFFSLCITFWSVGHCYHNYKIVRDMR